jgi:hypothetical protein
MILQIHSELRPFSKQRMIAARLMFTAEARTRASQVNVKNIHAGFFVAVEEDEAASRAARFMPAVAGSYFPKTRTPKLPDSFAGTKSW